MENDILNLVLSRHKTTLEVSLPNWSVEQSVYDDLYKILIQELLNLPLNEQSRSLAQTIAESYLSKLFAQQDPRVKYNPKRQILNG